MSFSRYSLYWCKKMKGCIECGKKLGIIEGYRHPTMGKQYHLCSHCYTIVFDRVEKYRKFITPYSEFFNTETSTMSDIQNIGQSITKNIKKIHNKANNLWAHKTNENANETLPIIN